MRGSDFLITGWFLLWKGPRESVRHYGNGDCADSKPPPLRVSFMFAGSAIYK